MADLSHHASTAFSDGAVEDQTSTDTGSDEHRQQIIDALPGAEAVLRQGAAVHVVPNRNWEIDRFLNSGLHVDRLIPAHDVCTADNDAMVDDEPRNADTDGGCLVGTLEVLDRGHDRFDHVVWTGLWRRHLAAPNGTSSGWIDQAGQNLRSAEIDPDVARQSWCFCFGA
jgi:hypothetical protein